jgi:L-arabinokinase
VAGALLVLMHEEGCTFNKGLSLLVRSEVPDGKGVSSSAALEVASMTVIAAAHGISLEPARLAALCQKVSQPVHLIIGAQN